MEPSESHEPGQKHIVIDARIRRSSTGRYTDRLLEHLQKIDFQNRYTVLLQPDDPWTPTRENSNFQKLESPFPQFSLNPMDDIKFAWQLNNLKPDLVHFTMTQQPLTYRGKVVTTTHDLTMLRFVRPGRSSQVVFKLKQLGYRTLFYVATKKSKRIIVPTEFVADDLSRHYPFAANKITVTYEASEPPIEEEGQKLQHPKLGNSPFIMHVGSPFPHKNLQRLIKAFEKLLPQHPDLKLVLAGKKEFYFEELEAWAEKRGSYNSIIFTGFIPDAELKWLYHNAKAYVLPSLSEGFGLPGLEAMAHNCPLVSSNETCLPEVYEEAALYFNPYDTSKIAEAVQKVLEDAMLKNKLIRAGQSQIKKYSWRRMAEQTLDVYREALN